MLQDISENLPRFNQYATVFKGRTMFEAALILVYNDIACFLTQAIHFYCRRGKPMSQPLFEVHCFLQLQVSQPCGVVFGVRSRKISGKS